MFSADDEVVDFTPPATDEGRRSSGATHGWPVELLPVRLTLTGAGLDLFERLVLESAAAGQRDLERLASLSGLEVAFLRTVAEDLQSRGVLGDDGAVTAVGRTHLADEVVETVDGWLARDGLSPSPLPVFFARRPYLASRDLPDVAPTALKRTDKLSDDDRAAFIDALSDWRQGMRDEPMARQLSVPSSLLKGRVEGIHLVRPGELGRLPVTLTTDADGAPEVIADGLSGGLLATRVERLRPQAWVQLEEEGRAAREELARDRTDDALRARVAVRLEEIWGAQVPERFRELLLEALTERELAVKRPKRHGTALTFYRQFCEAVAVALSPGKPSDRTRALVRQFGKGESARIEATLRPMLETLAGGTTLELPDQLRSPLVELSRGKKARPTHGLLLVAWPFFHAACDPDAPHSAAVRAAASRVPSMWLDLEIVRRDSNPGAHYREGRPLSPDYDRLDATVGRILHAVGAEAVPVEQESALDPTLEPKVRGALDRSRRAVRAGDWRAAADATWEAAAGAISSLVPVDVSLADLGRRVDDELPIDRDECRDLVRRRLEGLRPLDDDMVGYEPPSWALATALDAAERLRRGDGASRDAGLVWPLLACAVDWHGVAAAVKALLAQDDPWERLEVVVDTWIEAQKPRPGASTMREGLKRGEAVVAELSDLARSRALHDRQSTNGGPN